MPFVAILLLFGSPAPLDMPRAESFLVKEEGVFRLEDRYNNFDLWTSRAVDGRWIDDDGRLFTMSSLEVATPVIEQNGTSTRCEYSKHNVMLRKKDIAKLREAIASLSPVEIAEQSEPPRQKIRGYEEIQYWQGTNEHVIVCSYLKEKEDVWRLAIWELADGDDIVERRSAFEDDFLGKNGMDMVASAPLAKMRTFSERGQLIEDVRHSVTNYSGWRATGDREFIVLDNLPGRDALIVGVTNEFAELRARYEKAFPSEISLSNILCVARIYGSREAYLVASDADISWTAAYWDPIRRELVAYLPPDGEHELIRTLRHESFHQYLSYACSMIQASPWLNEGYAEYFEDTSGRTQSLGTAQEIDEFAEVLPALLKMDYAEFYGGNDLQRRLNYRLAKSIAEFIECGADKVRFQPFANIKRDYVAALIRTRNMHEATEAVFKNQDMLMLFISEWKKFWKNR